MSAATNSIETPIYQVIIRQFISCSFEVTKILAQNSFINTIIFIFALIFSMNIYVTSAVALYNSDR